MSRSTRAEPIDARSPLTLASGGFTGGRAPLVKIEPSVNRALNNRQSPWLGGPVVLANPDAVLHPVA
jgi:hypothetical protein